MPNRTVKIKVTQEDIDSGTPGDGRSCPIAKAIANRLCCVAYVDSRRIHWRGGRNMGNYHVVDNSFYVKDLISGFDDGEGMQPQTIQIQVPDWVKEKK